MCGKAEGSGEQEAAHHILLACFFSSFRSLPTVSVNCVNHCNKVAFAFRQDNMTTMWPFCTGPLWPTLLGSNSQLQVTIHECMCERETYW